MPGDGTKKGLLDKISDVFFEEKPEGETSDGGSEGAVEVPAEGLAKPPASATVRIATSAVNQGMFDEIAKRAAEYTKAYAAYIDMMAVLADAIPDEKQRSKGALAAVAKAGFSIQKIKGGLESAISSLENEQSIFESQLSVKSEESENLKKGLGEFDKQIAGEQEEIERLNEEIRRHQTTIAEINGDKSSKMAEIEKVQNTVKKARASFKAALDAVRADLTAKLNKISQ